MEIATHEEAEVEAEISHELQKPKIPVEEQIVALFDVLPALTKPGLRAINPWINSTHSLDIPRLFPQLQWTLLAPDCLLLDSKYPWLRPDWHKETLSVMDDEFDVRMRRDWPPFDLCVFAADLREAPLVLHRVAKRARTIACLTFREVTGTRYVSHYEPDIVIDFNNAQNTAWLIWGDAVPEIAE